MSSMQIVLQLKVLNNDSHFGEDKYGQAVLYVLLLIIFIALGVVNYQKYKEDQQRFEEEDSPLYFTFGSLNMVIMHCFLKNLHNFHFSNDGVGSMACEMFAHLLLLFSRITIITILIAFAFGWQVIYDNTIQVKKNVQWIYIFVLALTAYDDYKLSEWISEHPADLFHLLKSDIQWTFYFTRSIEYAIFCFAIWRSKRVANKKLDEETNKIEDDMAGDQKQNDMAITIQNNINSVRISFFNLLWFAGTGFFISTPIATTLTINFFRESNQQMMHNLIILGA